MTIYDDMRAVALDVMNEFQQGDISYVEIQRTEGATPDDPDEPVPVPYKLTATARPVSTKYVDGSHIIQSDRQITMPNDGRVEPDMSGYVTIDQSSFKIIEIMPRPAAGRPVVWLLIVRR